VSISGITPVGLEELFEIDIEKGVKSKVEIAGMQFGSVLENVSVMLFSFLANKFLCPK